MKAVDIYIALQSAILLIEAGEEERAGEEMTRVLYSLWAALGDTDRAAAILAYETLKAELEP